MTDGKRQRLSRLLKDGRMLCVPMDHGMSDGPIQGLEDINAIVRSVEEGGASSVILHKGMIKSLNFSPQLGLIMHVSGSTSRGPAPFYKVDVSGVREAILLGADAVSFHMNVGANSESDMMRSLGALADEADRWGYPLIAMMYVRGERVKDQFDPELTALAVRLGAELGADLVKTTYTGNIDSFAKVVKSSPVPVVIAGGPKVSSRRELLQMAKDALDAGAIGVTFGRNVFQDSDPKKVVKALSSIIFNDADVESALKEFDH
ncbi:MAG: fructose-bisphosphate aldolase [Nitrososphaerota archaeon]|nr:2-amino-3,7-dideoxy-D-threo-hept-6-ulosonate synthase [Nitrososphaerota archaeon]MDG7037768.1 fructose-bisphosphate aldolase [Nitrososphaerota archaeon]